MLCLKCLMTILPSSQILVTTGPCVNRWTALAALINLACSSSMLACQRLHTIWQVPPAAGIRHGTCEYQKEVLSSKGVRKNVIRQTNEVVKSVTRTTSEGISSNTARLRFTSTYASESRRDVETHAHSKIRHWSSRASSTTRIGNTQIL